MALRGYPEVTTVAGDEGDSMCLGEGITDTIGQSQAELLRKK